LAVNIHLVDVQSLDIGVWAWLRASKMADKNDEKKERKAEDKRLHKKIGRRLSGPAPIVEKPPTWSDRKGWR